MMNKRAGTFTGVVISILVVMGLFYGVFNYISFNYESANITEDLGYNQSYADLQTSQQNLSDNIEAVKSSAQSISEAPLDLVNVAWNGLTGLASTIRLFFGIVDVAVNVWNAILPGLSFLPTWVKLLIEMGIIIWIVLIIFAAFKGEPNS